jgi:xanthine dehydrogenase YagT iron-sulfur-binding subunit
MKDDGRKAPGPRASDPGLTRRDAIRHGLLAGAMLVAGPPLAGLPSAEEPLKTPTPASDLEVAFHLNGKPVRVACESRVTLLDLLREGVALPGTKKGCDHGQCGACTIHVDGRRVLSCLTLAATVQGKSVTTIEGLAHGEELHPLQEAFIAHDAFQCGFCTPGQIMSAEAFLREPGGKDPAQIREGMSGNICRCGAYLGIVAAIQESRRKAVP